MSERNFWRVGKNDVKDKVREMDDKRWQEEIQGKSSLKIYEEEKKEIKEELMYDNRPCSIIMYSVENLFPTFSPQERKKLINMLHSTYLPNSFRYRPKQHKT